VTRRPLPYCAMNVVRRAVEEPRRWIAANAAHEASSVVERVKEMNGDEGF